MKPKPAEIEKQLGNDLKTIEKLPVKTKELVVAELSKFDDAELERALHRYKVFNVSPELKKLLRDPLLLGFYRESAQEEQKYSGPPRTPLDLIQRHWKTQIAKIELQSINVRMRFSLGNW